MANAPRFPLITSNVTDYSRLTPGIRDAVQVRIPLRDNEIMVRAHHSPSQVAIHSSARLLIDMESIDPQDNVEKEMISLKTLDFGGKEPISQVFITHKDLPKVLRILFGMYEANGGNLDELMNNTLNFEHEE